MSESMFRTAPGTKLSRILRWTVPLLMILTGLGVMAFGVGATATGIGVALIGGSVVVVFAGWFGRLGDDTERIREQAARDEFLRTGIWPED
ncbi:MAG: hypothetical protein F2799_03785 [Actinobacteria bacterium]|uniref:Unannotated protein n=1 Tax=freshwater metagenome TaxID=449393 RepID=A0A6J7DSD6_9ZZZZ|nr:hypothetical protein [Actinomycetota bacterium]